MNELKVRFLPPNIEVTVKKDATLLEAASKASITINNLCGGDGICGRCKMIILKGDISGGISGKLTREEIKKGYVLACMTYIESDLTVEIPKETLAQEKAIDNEDTKRFRDFKPALYNKDYKISPLTTKAAIYAAMKILLTRLNLNFSDIEHFYIAGAFGNYLNIESSISIGLLPNISLEKVKFVENLKKIVHAVSLGCTETLVCLPVLTTMLYMPLERRTSFGVKPNTVRLSAGIENIGELLDDLKRSLMEV